MSTSDEDNESRGWVYKSPPVPYVCHSLTNMEETYYEWWKSSNFFKPNRNVSEPPLIMVLPPPNLTGDISHALTVAIQDTIVRWRRMSGYNSVWVSAIEFAGNETEHLFEEYLLRYKRKVPRDFGRQDLITEVLEWKDHYEEKIQYQLKLLGASLDWSHVSYSMDWNRRDAITKAFLCLHKDGLIFRDLRLVNWDCGLQRSVAESDIRHFHVERPLKPPGSMHKVDFHIETVVAYLLEEEALGEITVATTRVETIYGDTAIAVHPDDPRYKHLHGKFAINPLNGRRLPIICDSELVGLNCGTGAMKICPAHFQKDFEVGKRHNLEFINIFTDDGKIKDTAGGSFVGMNRFEARLAVIELLKSMKLHRGEYKVSVQIGCCDKGSRDVVELMLKPRWYVDCRSLVKEVLEMETKGINVIPQHYVAACRITRDNIGDWCISKESWWGVRVPAWYVTLEEDELKELGSYSNHWVVASNEKKAAEEAKRIFPGRKFQLAQDPDVVDTWFSSGLFPLSVLGWPVPDNPVKTFYANSVIVTRRENLNLWVAPMVILAMKLGGDVPFPKVYIHPSVVIKRSRTREYIETILDPIQFSREITLEDCLQIIKNTIPFQPDLYDILKRVSVEFPDYTVGYGADALRFTLLLYTGQSKDILLDEKRVAKYGKWRWKLWHVLTLSKTFFGDHYTPPTSIDPDKMPCSCQWILSVLNKAISKTISSLESYELSKASSAVYSWWKYQFCDIFIELIKTDIKGDDESAKGYAKDTLWVCLDNGLRLLHPFMPYVTEELWQRLPSPKHYARKKSIMICDYPSVVKSWTNAKVESDMKMIESAVKSLRSCRQNLPAYERNKWQSGFVFSRSDKLADFFRRHETEVSTLARLSSLKVLTENDVVPAGCAISVVNEELSVYLKFHGPINVDMECEKLHVKKTKLEKRVSFLNLAMVGRGYEAKVSEPIKEKNMRKKVNMKKSIRCVDEALGYLKQQ